MYNKEEMIKLAFKDELEKNAGILTLLEGLGNLLKGSKFVKNLGELGSAVRGTTSIREALQNLATHASETYVRGAGKSVIAVVPKNSVGKGFINHEVGNSARNILNLTEGMSSKKPIIENIKQFLKNNWNTSKGQLFDARFTKKEIAKANIITKGDKQFVKGKMFMPDREILGRTGTHVLYKNRLPMQAFKMTWTPPGMLATGLAMNGLSKDNIKESVKQYGMWQVPIVGQTVMIKDIIKGIKSPKVETNKNSFG